MSTLKSLISIFLTLVVVIIAFLTVLWILNVLTPDDFKTISGKVLAVVGILLASSIVITGISKFNK